MIVKSKIKINKTWPAFAIVAKCNLNPLNRLFLERIKGIKSYKTWIIKIKEDIKLLLDNP